MVNTGIDRTVLLSIVLRGLSVDKRKPKDKAECEKLGDDDRVDCSECNNKIRCRTIIIGIE